jgi:hypothetical protein
VGSFPSWAFKPRDVASGSGERAEWRYRVAHRVLPEKGMWRGEVKRSPTGFRGFGGRGPRVAAGAATRGYGRVPLQGTGGSKVVSGRGASCDVRLGRDPKLGQGA